MQRVVLLVLACATALDAVFDQSLSIRGLLRCHKKPLANTEVRLYEKRKSLVLHLVILTALLRNTLMVSNKTDSNGEFYLNGSTSRILPISPLLYIEKDCKGKSHDVKLPNLKTEITWSKAAKHTIDIGIINLI
ncbi:Transthyretin-like family protein [Oesophagostomum dentatum]|uniref:Transthyretin-like family protein n=1 Tax=Oesophagostomum dentatum TaxID=61180 RepID=A0A0B1SZ99_OESDE|nr:Transthyretin-like family protein [Oesophagostomum dentatum]